MEGITLAQQIIPPGRAAEVSMHIWSVSMPNEPIKDLCERTRECNGLIYRMRTGLLAGQIISTAPRFSVTFIAWLRDRTEFVYQVIWATFWHAYVMFWSNSLSTRIYRFAQQNPFSFLRSERFRRSVKPLFAVSGNNARLLPSKRHAIETVWLPKTSRPHFRKFSSLLIAYSPQHTANSSWRSTLTEILHRECERSNSFIFPFCPFSFPSYERDNEKVAIVLPLSFEAAIFEVGPRSEVFSLMIMFWTDRGDHTLWCQQSKSLRSLNTFLSDRRDHMIYLMVLGALYCIVWILSSALLVNR